MLFLVYYELNEEASFETNLQATQKIMAKGLFPPQGVNLLRWDITPDSWGVAVAEADNIAAITQAVNVWRAAIPGFFKVTKTAPAWSVQESIAQATQVLQTLGS